MAVAKKNSYTTTELDWAEQQLITWKAYIDANPMHLLTDRINYKETRGGGVMPMVVASIEAQGKYLQETMKNYLALLEVVERLREKDAAKKVETRGGVELGDMASDFLANRDSK